MKIVTLTGNKNTKKDYVASKLSENSDVHFIKPYTDAPLPIGEPSEKYGGYQFISKEELDWVIENEEVISLRKINGHRYVYTESQLQAGYNILVVDDYMLLDVRENYPIRDIYSIKLRSKNEKKSDRVDSYLFDHEFDEVFDVDSDDFDELEARISYS